MSKVLKKIFILLAVFIAALLIFFRLTNHEMRDLTTDMAKPQLPVVYLEQNGTLLNELHGYVNEMDALTMRDAIAPVGADRVLNFNIKTLGNKISGLSYEIRSLDMERLVDKQDEVEYSETDGQIKSDIKLADIMESDTEYLMILKIHQGNQTIYYYTRVMSEDDRNVTECLDFVKNFHDMTLDPAKSSRLSKYLEPSSEADNGTLQKVTIENRLSQVTWGSMDVKEVAEPVVSVKEMNDSYSVIAVYGIVSAENENGGTDYFQTEEYYRVRMGNERMYLLNFERTVNEIFSGEADSISGRSILLGIRSADVDYWSNETGSIVCFVQEGELWSYNQATGQLTKVYSFRSSETTDVREDYDQHNIRIVKATETGSIDFIVYGYMNSGDHEGQVGISVCHYDSITNSVEEWIFIPSNVSYQVMKEKINQLMYTSDSGSFYLAVGDSVHAIDIESRKERVLLEGLQEGNYQVSDDGRYLAWVDKGKTNSSDILHIMDLNTEIVSEVKAESGSYIKPLGFLGADCIYGLAKSGDMKSGQNFPMYSVQILEFSKDSQEVVKTYEKPGYFVRSVEVSDGTIYLNLMRYRNGKYESSGKDTITNQEMEENQQVHLDTVTTEKKQEQMCLVLADTKEVKGAVMRTAKLIIPEKSNVVNMDETVFTSGYYVYAKGNVLFATNSAARAVILADRNMGVVVDSSQRYVWERAKAERHTAMEPKNPAGSSQKARALNVMLDAADVSTDADAMLSEGLSSYDILKKQMEGFRVLNISGCSLDEALYFVGEGSYVYSEGKDAGPILLTGYDGDSVWIYNPSKGENKKLSLEQAQEDIKGAGNIYYTYLK